VVDEDRTLNHLLDRMEHAARQDTVSVDDVLHEFGDRAITPFILLIALMLVSPLSGIPGVPTFAAALIILLSTQALVGRRRLWLPGFLLRREIASKRLLKAVEWMRRPCAFVDRHSHSRLRYLTVGPARSLTLLACAVIPIGWPLLEVLPMVSSIGAAVVALLSFGLFTRDGLYVLLGYAGVVITASVGLWFLL
tara:strand:- start:436 stop:1017 length:582 start_codon:yes stop_codon:yes gene_type:complete